MGLLKEGPGENISNAFLLYGPAGIFRLFFAVKQLLLNFTIGGQWAQVVNPLITKLTFSLTR